jgi:acyl dehydratase
MAAAVSYDDVEVGTELPALEVRIRRSDLVRYAGASGDFNPIHWNQRVATAVGLPDVIAHGMFTMAQAGRAVTAWAGDPGAVVQYGVRMIRPVVVPDDDDGALLRIEGRVAEKLEERRVRVDLTATSGGVKVLGQARAVVQLG